jgi:hypothetical protein
MSFEDITKMIDSGTNTSIEVYSAGNGCEFNIVYAGH